jgi:hypothetical protein
VILRDTLEFRFKPPDLSAARLGRFGLEFSFSLFERNSDLQVEL